MRWIWDLFVFALFIIFLPIAVVAGIYYVYIWFTVTVVKSIWGG